jgi:hypothetical protein
MGCSFYSDNIGKNASEKARQLTPAQKLRFLFSSGKLQHRLFQSWWWEISAKAVAVSFFFTEK